MEVSVMVCECWFQVFVGLEWNFSVDGLDLVPGLDDRRVTMYLGY